MTSLRIQAHSEYWPIAGAFTIARGAKTEAAVIVCECRAGGALGRGECVPYRRYGESLESVLSEIEMAGAALEEAAQKGADCAQLRAALASLLGPGAARNALDCALWDLEAKQSGMRVWRLAGLDAPGAVETAYTISLNSPEKMAHDAAGAAARYPLLKLKLGGEGDEERVRAIRAAAPHARLIADANEAWPLARLDALMAACAAQRIELVEQPVPAGEDEALAGSAWPVPLCADEAAHSRADLTRIGARYQAVNIKLDKAGGLSEALAMAQAAQAMGLKVMVGCMVGTSLAMAPALVLAPMADWVDLDGPLLLARDRQPGLSYDGARIEPPPPELWG